MYTFTHPTHLHALHWTKWALYNYISSSNTIWYALDHEEGLTMAYLDEKYCYIAHVLSSDSSLPSKCAMWSCMPQVWSDKHGFKICFEKDFIGGFTPIYDLISCLCLLIKISLVFFSFYNIDFRFYFHNLCFCFFTSQVYFLLW